MPRKLTFLRQLIMRQVSKGYLEHPLAKASNHTNLEEHCCYPVHL